MKRPGFFEGVAVAFAASLGGGALFAALTTVFAGASVLRLLIAVIALAYVLYLLGRSAQHIGRITALALWCVVAGVAWFMDPPLLLYVLIHLGLVWLIRSLYFYSSVLCALADLGLTGMGLAVAIWAVVQSESMFLSLWSFFLVQALFVAIPARMTGKPGERKSHDEAEDPFQRAHRAAEAAVRKLSSVR